ncbi:MAG: hypothetical protein EOP00_01755 [Pedobacter sp.]|nr:MAG: hypothetical protein EOP00_01755 [Pedobacter sp.]
MTHCKKEIASDDEKSFLAMTTHSPNLMIYYDFAPVSACMPRLNYNSKANLSNIPDRMEKPEVINERGFEMMAGMLLTMSTGFALLIKNLTLKIALQILNSYF